MTTLTGTLATQLIIEVDGTPLNPIVQGLLVSAEVESNLFYPDHFRLTFRGPRTKVLELGALQLAVMVTLQMDVGEGPIPMFMGEITAVEVDYGPTANMTVVSGFDRSHRMMMGTSTMAWNDMTSSDIVTAILAENEIPPGQIEPTENIYTVIAQPNVSDWAFIQHLAQLEGRDAYVSNGLFNFSIPKQASEGIPPALDYMTPPVGGQLVLGKNLVRLHAVISSAEQVADVEVLGWDPLMGIPVVGDSPVAPWSSESEDIAAMPATVAGELGATKLTATDWPMDSEGAAEARALGLAQRIAGSFAEMEGECIGDPEIYAGSVVSLGMAGPPFDGMYVVASARHRYEPGSGGYTTWFTVGGRSDRSVLSLAGGGTDTSNGLIVPGVVIGKVVDSNDPESMCRVKVMYPWLDETYVSDWARCVQLGAGEAYGFVIIPEVGTEVLLAFDRGDVSHPYVIGNLYNSVVRPDPPPAITGTVDERRIVSRMLHKLQFLDDPADAGITLVTGDETCSLKLNATETTISITSEGQVSISGAAKVSISSEGDLSISATGMLSLSSDGDVSISSEGALSVSATADLSLSSDGITSVGGSMIQLGG